MKYLKIKFSYTADQNYLEYAIGYWHVNLMTGNGTDLIIVQYGQYTLRAMLADKGNGTSAGAAVIKLSRHQMLTC